MTADKPHEGDRPNTGNQHSESPLQKESLDLRSSGSASAVPFADEHPRREDVLKEFAALNSQINGDYMHLGGHYWELENKLQNIQRQEQADAKAHGGHITSAEEAGLKQEEKNLAAQVAHDYLEGPPKGDFKTDYPNRYQVKSGDEAIDKELVADRGKLGAQNGHGQYGNLFDQMMKIEHEAQNDFRANHGKDLTSAQTTSLMAAEAALIAEIKKLDPQG